MKIAVAGAGAMGSRFGWTLRHNKNDVVLIDSWDKNIEEVRKNGVTAEVNGEVISEKMPIFYPKELKDNNSNFDLIIIFTKAMGLKNMLSNIKPVIGKDTYILCLLNGLGHEDTLKQFVNEDHIIMGVTMVATNMIGPGHVKFEGGGSTELQPLKAETKPATEQIIEVFKAAGLEASYSENVLYSIWRKACVNGVMNPICALLETNNIGFGKSPTADAITRTIINEFASVAEKETIHLDREEVINHVEETWSVAHYPSMYQDLIVNHRFTEIDYIDGAVWKKGKEYGIDTPYCACITELIHSKEAVMGVE